ncbi:hypothetical protein GOA77_09145 [Sinorhizobium meliloti]|nr:hypothetical protein [Sinorhizobium meliloti]
MSNDLVPFSGAPSSGSGSDVGGGTGYGSHSTALSPPQSTGRRAEIERIMQTDRARYFREGLDQELAELRAAEDGGEDFGSPTLPMAPSRSMQSLQATEEGANLVSAWRNSPGGFEAQLRKVQADVGFLVRELGDLRHQRAFMEGFDRRVTERARYHIYDEIKNGSPTNPHPATSANLAVFGSTEPGAELLKEWGPTAAAKVGRVWARVARFRANLSNEADFASFTTWYDNLSPSAVKAIVKYLAR